MTEELEQLLKNLRLRRMLSVYDEQLQAAEKAQVSYSEFVAGLLRSQWHDRQESALEWRIRRQLLNRLARLDVLLIDEFGYLNLKPEQSNTLEAAVVAQRVGTTNLMYDEWQNFLGNKSMVEALLSRVRHYCHTVTINGPSLRDPQG